MSSTEVVEKAVSEEADREALGFSVLFHERSGGRGVTHTPIIITDGSASIEFAESEYIPVMADPDRRRSSGLHLVKVSAHRDHDRGANPESLGRVCVPLVAGELYEIEVACARDGQPLKNFIVGGGPTFSPEIRFEHGVGGEYQKNTTDFPSIDLGQRFGNLMRNITRMQIFRIQNGMRVRIHDCGRVENGCEYRLLDIH